MDRRREELATTVGRLLSGRRLGCAESFTGGQLSQAFSAAESSSEWFRGGVVAYQAVVKHHVLGVPPGPLVSPETAVAMARGVAELLDVEVAVSSTGAAGPDGLDGAPPGTVVIGWLIDGATGTATLAIDGSPGEVCARATDAALERLVRELEDDPATPPEDEAD